MCLAGQTGQTVPVSIYADFVLCEVQGHKSPFIFAKFLHKLSHVNRPESLISLHCKSLSAFSRPPNPPVGALQGRPSFYGHNAAIIMAGKPGDKKGGDKKGGDKKGGKK